MSAGETMYRRVRSMEEDFFLLADAILGDSPRGRMLKRTTSGFEFPDSTSNIGLIEGQIVSPELQLRDAITLEIKAIAHSGQWDTMVFFPPIGGHIGISNTLDYLDAILRVLNHNGRLIIAIPGNLLTANGYRDWRERVLRTCHLNSLIEMPVRNYDIRGICIIDLAMGRPSDAIDCYAFGEETAFEELLRRMQSKKPSFTVTEKDLHERWDASFLDPRFNDARKDRASKDTIKLGDVADVISGCFSQPEERKDQGEYLVLVPSLITNGLIRYDDERASYVDGPGTSERFECAVLQDGDIVVSCMRTIRFATFRQANQRVVANQNVCIIRSKPEYRELVNLYFGTKLGEESFNTQAEMLGRGIMNHVSAADLRTFVIPDIKTLTLAAKLQENRDYEDRIAMLFEAEGWKVERDYRLSSNAGVVADIALITDDKLVGVVETKRLDHVDGEIKQQVAYTANSWNNVGVSLFLLFIGDKMYRYENGSFYRIPDVPAPTDYDAYLRDLSEYRDDPLNSSIKEMPEARVSPASEYAILSALENLTALAEETLAKVNAISAQLQELTDRIAAYQDLVSMQLKYASDDAEMQECILKSFTDTCVERISTSMRVSNSEALYADEERRLIESIGSNAWGKIGDDARRFLISSKFMYAKLADVEDIVDYSGVCLLVTKALELELGKRFCVGYIQYYKNAHPGRDGRYTAPLPIVDKYRNYIKPKAFTLGSFPYIVGQQFVSDISEDEERNIRSCILEYAKHTILKSYSKTHGEERVLDLLDEYAEEVERVRKEYRNPSAHTNALTRTSAKECFDLVLDVEKLLRRILESFDE